MNYFKIQEYRRDVYPAIILDELLPHTSRRKLRTALLVLTLLTFGTLLVDIELLSPHVFLLRAVLVLFFCMYSGLILLEAMYRSCYFEPNRVDFRVLSVINTSSKKADLTARFLNHELGQYAMYRLGFSQADIDQFLSKKTDVVTRQEFEIVQNDDRDVSFAEFGFSLVHFDSDLSQLLRQRGVTVADFRQTLEWVARMDQEVKDHERWWTKENLMRIPSLGRNLAFGQVRDLERFGHSIVHDTAYVQLGEKWRTYRTSVRKIEAVLAKAVGGNIILTAKESYLALDAMASLGKEIIHGTAQPILENKRIYVLDVNLLISTYDQSADFGAMLQLVLRQAAAAGNVILVIPDFADFVQNTHSLGIDVKDIVREALQSTRLQVVMTSSDRSFHEVLETDLDLMTHFEKVQLTEFDSFQAISILQQEVLRAEAQEHMFFTYQAVKRIVESADRYFADTSLLDKSIDILYEVIPTVRQQGMSVVTQDHVDALVTSKTGITLGKISKDESQKLAHIGDEMKKRVVGQDAAVEAVTEAMLRARTGLANPKRPLASFLFVGPTGVGKTETAKALAALFFGDEENMLRSDMSEYSDGLAISRMIGDTGHAGVFASKVRERGHGVLLLDEFEKASREVHDLFLQIIDEGFFTDGRGERINMRNFIIIATSNAGSEMFARREHLVDKQSIIDFIISNHLLRSEMLNRFDDVIIFDSLAGENLTTVAHLAVQRLVDRLDKRGITLKETPELLNYLVKVGTNPTFGAREINRVITKELESKIAQALVLGDLFEGDTISFTVSGNELEIQKYS